MHREADISDHQGFPYDPPVRKPGAASEGAGIDHEEWVGS